jgi:hypothetical protein
MPRKPIRAVFPPADADASPVGPMASPPPRDGVVQLCTDAARSQNSCHLFVILCRAQKRRSGPQACSASAFASGVSDLDHLGRRVKTGPWHTHLEKHAPNICLLFTMSSGVIATDATGAVSTDEFCQLALKASDFTAYPAPEPEGLRKHDPNLDPNARKLVVQIMSCVLPPPATFLGLANDVVRSS